MLDARSCNAFNVPRWRGDLRHALVLVHEAIRSRGIPTARALAQRTGLSLVEAGQVIGKATGCRRG